MPEVTLAQVKKALPYGAWLRSDGLPTKAFVRPDLARSENHSRYLTPEAIHERISEPCWICEGDGKCICVLCDPDDRRYNGTTVECGDHRFVYVDHDDYGPGCRGTGSAAPELWELVQRG